MTTNLIFLVVALSCAMICWVGDSNGDTPKIPGEFGSFIARVTTPIEYKEILPFHGGERIPIPATITRSEALEDINMFEYLLETSYAGFEYWEHKGLDFGTFFSDLRDFVSRRDILPAHDFEEALSGILKRIYDGHIALTGLGYNHAYRHKAVYYCDILVEGSDEGLFTVKDSKMDGVKTGDLHRQWVFSIPKRLRIYFMYDRKLLSKLSRCAWPLSEL